MGTSEFAVPGLRRLLENGFDIAAVITAPDKPKGRGKQTGISPVKDFAIKKGLDILQPPNLKDPKFQENLRSYQADVQIITAFRMLPESVWNMPPMGSYNLHASLLPDYRGAAPINWAIMNGETETGVTVFKLKHEIDTGNILFQEKEPIYPEDNVGALYERLMNKGAELLVKAAGTLANGNVELREQKAPEAKIAPKIFREDCKIDWQKKPAEIHNKVRGLSPRPAAWTILDGKVLKIYEAMVSPMTYPEGAGNIQSDNKTYLDITNNNGALRLLEVQLQGKKRMKAENFLRGYNVTDAEIGR